MRRSVSTTEPGLYDITGEVKTAINESGVQEGLCVVYSLTASAGVLITAPDLSVHEDIIDDLERILPPRTNYCAAGRPEIASANSSAALSGRPLDIIIQDRKAALGRSQGVFLLDTSGKQNIEYGIICI